MDEFTTDNEQLKNCWQQCIAGDAGSLGIIHARLFDGLYNYALKMLRDEGLAADAVQELFIKIWNKRHTIGVMEKVKPYFFSVLRRQLLNQLRDQKRKTLKISLFIQPDIEFSHEEIVVKKEEDNSLKQQILQLLNTLPQRQKEIIYLHYFENMSLAQVSDVMQINYQSVQNLKQRAIHNLRTAGVLSFFLFLYTSGLLGK